MCNFSARKCAQQSGLFGKSPNIRPNPVENARLTQDLPGQVKPAVGHWASYGVPNVTISQGKNGCEHLQSRIRSKKLWRPVSRIRSGVCARLGAKEIESGYCNPQF